MKLHSHNRLVKTDITSEAVDFGIDAEDAQGLTILLRDTLYEDKMLAPIREYIANAFDANAEMSNVGPINIFLPTTDFPQFKIRDFGPGLTEDEVYNIFTRYGKSTKRDTNNVTGCFGIGSKSYAAYTDKATVISRQNGIKRIYVMYLDSNQQAKLKKVSEMTEPRLDSDIQTHRGLEISWAIDLSDIQAARDKFLRMAKYWDQSEYPVTVNETYRDDYNIKQVKEIDISSNYASYSIDCEHFKIEENAEVRSSKYDYNKGRYVSESAKLIMGPITYPLNAETIENNLSDKQKAFLETNGLVIKVPLGTVSVAASREGLSYDSITKAALQSKIENCLSTYETMIQEEVRNAPNWMDAYLKAQAVRQSLVQELREGIEFKWKDFPLKYSLTIDYELPIKLATDGSKIEISTQSLTLEKYYLHETRASNTLLKKDQVQYFNADTRKIFIVCDHTHTTPHQAARKIKYYLMKQWDDHGSTTWDGRKDQFEAYAVWLNRPDDVIAYEKGSNKHHSKSEGHPMCLSIKKLPEWFGDLKQIKCEDIIVPKNHKISTGSGTKQPKKILKVDLDMKSWRGAISSTPDAYDLTSELCTLVTSHYKPSTQDLEYPNDPTVKIKKGLAYSKRQWDGDPELVGNILKAVSQYQDRKFTIMPIRGSQLKDSDIKALPSISDVATQWAIEYLKSLPKEELSLLQWNLEKSFDTIIATDWLEKLLFNDRHYYPSYNDYHDNVENKTLDMFKNNQKMVEYREDVISKIKSPKIKELFTSLIDSYNAVHEAQSKEHTLLAFRALWASGYGKKEKVDKSSAMAHRFSSSGHIMQSLGNLIPQLSKSNPILKSLEKLLRLNRKFELLPLLYVTSNRYYNEENRTVENYKESGFVAPDGGTSANLLIGYLNRELK